jgi:deoxyribodipyrimidine photolyase
MTTGQAVFTRDLRIADNPALTAAASASAQVIPCFVIDELILDRQRSHATRLAFLVDSLRDLDAGLRGLGGSLIVRRGPWAAAVLEVARTSGARRIDVADDYSAYAQRRLAELERAAAGRSQGDKWRADGAALDAWQRGETGYPVVDAAMRQLLTEGFMHNQARMIVASFLTKDLYLDWRLGAAHFMARLADGDVACNQLNWQWVAGTGTDASAHRVFNPVVQGRRFDPEGDYVRRYLPELATLPAGVIHDPDPATRRACGYPRPIVDHRAAVAEYRQARAAANRQAVAACAVRP